MSEQTLEGVAAIRLRRTADEMISAAEAMMDVGTPEARLHAREMRGAAKIAKGWARELERQHRQKVITRRKKNRP